MFHHEEHEGHEGGRMLEEEEEEEEGEWVGWVVSVWVWDLLLPLVRRFPLPSGLVRFVSFVVFTVLGG